MRTHVKQHAPGEWHVWTSLDTIATEDLDAVGESFIIGIGSTEAAAKADAVKDLQAAIAELQGPLLPAGTPDPRD